MESEDKIQSLGDDHFKGPNIVSTKGTLTTALGLEKNYHPIVKRAKVPRTVLYNTTKLYPKEDKELDIISKTISTGVGFIHTREDGEIADLRYHHLLRLPNSPEDVRFRQQAIKELVEKPELLTYIKDMIDQASLYFFQGREGRELTVICETAPERIKTLTDKIAALQSLGAESQAFQKAYSWANKLRQDTFFLELVKQQRSIFDSRIFSVYSERFDHTQLGILKPGVNPEDVFNFLTRQTTGYELMKINKKGQITSEERKVVKFKTDSDEEITQTVVGQARQRMDVLNHLTAHIMATPVYLTLLQLRHYTNGAQLHNQLIEQGYPAVFPDISDKPHEIKTRGILPIRLVLENIHHAIAYHNQILHKRLCPNDFAIDQRNNIILAEGHNTGGKSEAWRTIHLATALTNAGYSIPTNSALMGTAQCHFISCKGDHGTGGSEFERGMKGVIDGLESVLPGDRLILDEFGDATNRHTASCAGTRLLPELIANQNQVFITSHHDAFTSYVKRKLHGVSLTPDLNARGIGKYRLVPSRGKVDFKSEETLDGMDLTKKRFKKALAKKQKFKPIEEKPEQPENDDEIAF